MSKNIWEDFCGMVKAPFHDPSHILDCLLQHFLKDFDALLRIKSTATGTSAPGPAATARPRPKGRLLSDF